MLKLNKLILFVPKSCTSLFFVPWHLSVMNCYHSFTKIAFYHPLLSVIDLAWFGKTADIKNGFSINYSLCFKSFCVISVCFLLIRLKVCCDTRLVNLGKLTVSLLSWKLCSWVRKYLQIFKTCKLKNGQYTSYWIKMMKL